MIYCCQYLTSCHLCETWFLCMGWLLCNLTVLLKLQRNSLFFWSRQMQGHQKQSIQMNWWQLHKKEFIQWTIRCSWYCVGKGGCCIRRYRVMNGLSVFSDTYFVFGALLWWDERVWNIWGRRLHILLWKNNIFWWDNPIIWWFYRKGFLTSLWLFGFGRRLTRSIRI